MGSNGLVYMLDLAGQALEQANAEINALRQRVAELESGSQSPPPA